MAAASEGGAGTGRRKLLVVMGTRPEAIKLAPVVIAARKQPERFDTQVVITCQHREMLDQMLAEFEIEVDVDLDIMRPDQSLAHVTSAALNGLYDTIGKLKPDWVIVQGDTSSTFAGALAAFYHRVKVAHVEAGLRTWDKFQPFPEEINRCLTGQLTDFHFPPTESARGNLLREGVDPNRVLVTGNTSIDALLYTIEKIGRPARTSSERTLLVTAHRRENHGAPMERICDALLDLVARFDDLRVVYPVHLSPRVRQVVQPKLGGHARIELVEPMDYRTFVAAMAGADIILTDSGGVQEEAPSLGRPVLVMRETTERPEAVEAGAARLVGADPKRIVDETSRLLTDSSAYAAMATVRNPYGDGQAAGRILGVLGST